MSCGCCVALSRGTMGLSTVCDCGISSSYSLIIINARRLRLISHITHIKHVFFHFVVYLFSKDISCYIPLNEFLIFSLLAGPK